MAKKDKKTNNTPQNRKHRQSNMNLTNVGQRRQYSGKKC